MTLLIDLSSAPCSCTNHALEELHKAMAVDQDSLFRPHESPYIRRHTEEVTARHTRVLSEIQHALSGVFLGDMEVFNKSLGWTRFTEKEMDVLKARLSEKLPVDYTLYDWMMVVDWIVHRYLPKDVIDTEADFLAIRSVLAGKVQSALQRKTDTVDDAIMLLVSRLPISIMDIPFDLNPIEQATIAFSRARAAEFITDLGDRARHRIKQLIINHEQLGPSGGNDKETLWDLEASMRDEFGILNRDWRRVAVSETARNANEGFVSSLPEGSTVKRMEAYDGACSFCDSLNGKIFKVVEPSKEGKDGWSEIWTGKTNVGRSSSPRKRVGEELVERLDNELWWPAAGIQHPNCRGTWQTIMQKPDTVNDDFAEWLETELARS